MSFDPYSPYGPLVDTTMRVVTWNVWGRYGPWEQREAGIEDVLAGVEPDIVYLVESWGSREASQADRIGDRLGVEHRLLVGDWDHEGTSGIGVISRWPIAQHERHPLRGDEGNGMGEACFAAIDGPRGPVQLFVVMLDYPLHASGLRQAQVRQLAHFVARMTRRRHPIVVCGEFTPGPDSDELRMLTGRSRRRCPASSSTTPGSWLVTEPPATRGPPQPASRARPAPRSPLRLHPLRLAQGWRTRAPHIVRTAGSHTDTRATSALRPLRRRRRSALLTRPPTCLQSPGTWSGRRAVHLSSSSVVHRDDPKVPYYQRDLALVHHLGFGFHADLCAPGILELLQPVRAREGLIVELGCGSGLLTKHLIDAGHRVVATDASPAMLDLARRHAPGAEDIRLLALPDDPIPAADAIVSVGHALNYLPDADSLNRALAAAAQALRPDGILAIDLCDLEWGEARRSAPDLGRVGDNWAIVTEFSVPSPDRFVRQMAVFVRDDDGSWRRDDERHDNVLIDTSQVPTLLARHGVESRVALSFGAEQLPIGLRTVIGHRLA